jgi:pteridine reductase
MLELAGRRALVTGAGRRIGAAIARALGSAGMHVGVHYHSSAAGAEATCTAIRAAGGHAVPLAADLGDREQARALVDHAIAALGGLDLLVLSAANFERAAVEQIDDRLWDAALSVNLTAPFVIAQRAVPALRAARGSIVIITCVSRLAPYRDYMAYEASKAGLHQLMRVLAIELAPDVRVNAVAPGSVQPPDAWSDAQRAELAARIPLAKLGDAADVADAVLHLARSEWMTGSEIVVDGGRTLT